jgi:hypothetical protein
MAAMKNAYTPATPAVAKSKVVSTPVKTAKAAPQAVPMPPQRPAGITPSYPTGNAAMAYGPAREKGSMPFTPFAGSVKVSGGTGFGGGGGGGFGGGYGGGGGGLNPGSNSSKSGTKSGPTAGREPGGSK